MANTVWPYTTHCRNKTQISMIFSPAVCAVCVWPVFEKLCRSKSFFDMYNTETFTKIKNRNRHTRILRWKISIYWEPTCNRECESERRGVCLSGRRELSLSHYLTCNLDKKYRLSYCYLTLDDFHFYQTLLNESKGLISTAFFTIPFLLVRDGQNQPKVGTVVASSLPLSQRTHTHTHHRRSQQLDQTSTWANPSLLPDRKRSDCRRVWVCLYRICACVCESSCET